MLTICWNCNHYRPLLNRALKVKQRMFISSWAVKSNPKRQSSYFYPCPLDIFHFQPLPLVELEREVVVENEKYVTSVPSSYKLLQRVLRVRMNPQNMSHCGIAVHKSVRVSINCLATQTLVCYQLLFFFCGFNLVSSIELTKSNDCHTVKKLLWSKKSSFMVTLRLKNLEGPVSPSTSAWRSLATRLGTRSKNRTDPKK